MAIAGHAAARRRAAAAALLLLLLAVGTGWCVPGLGYIAELLTALAPGWAAPSFYSVAVLGTARRGADVGAVVERLLSAGVRPPQIMLLNTVNPPQDYSGFYTVFAQRWRLGIRGLAPSARLQAEGAAEPARPDECLGVASAAEQMLLEVGKWEADWTVLLPDDSALRPSPSAGRELSGVLRGWDACRRGIVRLAPQRGDPPLGWALHRALLPQLAAHTRGLCAQRAQRDPPPFEAVLAEFEAAVLGDSGSGGGQQPLDVVGLFGRDASPPSPAPSLPRCPAAQEMKLMVAVPTYNRPAYVELMASSLMGSDGLRQGVTAHRAGHAAAQAAGEAPTVPVDLRVFDDSSTEYDEAQLGRWFDGATVTRNAQNVGPDENSRLIMEAFVASDANVLLVADSDLLYHPRWIATLRTVLPHAHGVLSLYNSVVHKARYCDEEVCVKSAVGTAATVFCRSVAQGVLDAVVKDEKGQVKVGGGHGFDWGYSRYFESAGVPLLALNRSMVEHFGRRGSWGAISSGEVAQNFDWKGVPAGLREGYAKMNEGAPSSAG